MCELLEHVENPKKVLKEARRLVGIGGFGLITMPFLNQLHADPRDFQRWTPTKLRAELGRAGFRVEAIVPMGGVFAVIYDLMLASVSRWQEYTNRPLVARMFRIAMRITLPLFLFFDRRSARMSQWITTGWAVTVFAK